MKIAIFTILFLSPWAEIRADLSHKPEKVQSLVKKLFNLTPNPNIAYNLAEPVKLVSGEEREEVSSKEIHLAEGKYAYYKFKNVIVSRNESEKRNSHSTQLICDFHQLLTISRSIDPPNLVIRGDYDTSRNPNNQSSQSFLVNQFDGRITYKITCNGTDYTDLVYNNQELKFGQLRNNHISIIQAIGSMVDQVGNRTAKKETQNGNLAKKIKDFESVFPFLSDSLSAINKTALRSQDENSYSIHNTIPEQWSNMNWTLSYVLVRGLNNFKRVKITATKESIGGVGVRFNMVLITNKLGGYFEWKYSNNDQLMISPRTENFTFDNLTLTIDTRFEENWVVDNVNTDLGRLHIQKANEDELCPDINVFANDIFHESLNTLIKRHIKELIRAEYSQPMRTTFNTTSTHAAANTTNQIAVDLSKIPSTPFLNGTTKMPSNSTPCIDDRRWWQKIYKRNKCKFNKDSAVTSTPAPKTAETDECIDKRWWFQKPFIRNKCKPGDKIKSDAA